MDTETEKDLRDAYSTYTLKMYCDITNIDGNDDSASRVNFGCCLRDLSQSGGGYCLRLNSSSDGFVTAFLTEANFETILASPYEMSDISDVTDEYDGITTFYIVTAESDTSTYNYWTGIKA